ncbi:MAG: S41 family peptidase [Cyclobacteriaceae bacterium]|nr:S41 family peptidase [Cyclobacteriaceae bacterium]
MLKSNKPLLITGLLFVIVISIASIIPGNRYFEIAKNLDVFASLYKEVNTYYVDEVNPNKLMRSGIDAMLASLDPYTNYISENEIEDYRTANTGEYGGIGVVTTNINGHTKVILVNENYTAHKNGIKTGDEIIEVDGTNIVGMSSIETNVIMKGQAGSIVNLKIKRHNEPISINFTLEREKVSIEHVPYFGMLDNEVGYIKLTEFTMHVSKDMKESVTALKNKGAKKLVFDLRDNPGGLLMEAVNICNIFIDKGQKIVETKGKITKNNLVYKTTTNPLDTEIPIVVLINSGSASASEIVAGTLQDYDRAVIVGEKSYGKGLVQVPRPLSYNSQLKVTTAKYYTPSGRCIQALDYGNRNPDGSVGKIPDSLISEFKTKIGRSVFDGGGVDPDISIPSEKMAPVSASLFLTGLTFDYATEYYYKHKVIPSSDKFSLTNTEYEDFKSWLKTQNYQYQSDTELQLDSIEKLAKKEMYYEKIEDNIARLRKIIAEEKSQLLTTYQSQISRLIEQDIATHYYFERGKVQSSLKSDPQLQSAMEVLKDTPRYSEILGNI